MRTMAFLDQIDQRIGDGLEAVLRSQHRRRLSRLGWLDALEQHGDTWWSSRTPVRSGNRLEVLIDGESALPAMEEAIRGAQRSVTIANWHASPQFRLTRGPAAISLRDLLAEVADRVPVRLLLWAGPPVPAFQPTRKTVNQVREAFTAGTKVQCALDSRERTMHCHHEKVVVIDDTVAFVGGMDFTDLQGDRNDASAHPPRAPMGWHDAALRLTGPAVADVARHVNSRWTEITGESIPAARVPPPSGSVDVQVLRTVPERTYQFAPRGEFTILDAYLEALRSAQSYIYLENQFLWSPEIVDVLAYKLQHPPSDDFRVLLLLPSRPSNGADTTRGQLGRLLEADNSAKRLLATTISGYRDVDSVPVYVHAKIGLVDDRWLTVGSANLNEHSLFNDTELNLLTCDSALARETRLRLWSEHTQRPADALTGDPTMVIDEVWRTTAEEESRRIKTGLPRTHRLSLLANVSRRSKRLQGPVRGLLVDG